MKTEVIYMFLSELMLFCAQSQLMINLFGFRTMSYQQIRLNMHKDEKYLMTFYKTNDLCNLTNVLYCYCSPSTPRTPG